MSRNEIILNWHHKYWHTGNVTCNKVRRQLFLIKLGLLHDEIMKIASLWTFVEKHTQTLYLKLLVCNFIRDIWLLILSEIVTVEQMAENNEFNDMRCRQTFVQVFIHKINKW